VDGTLREEVDAV